MALGVAVADFARETVEAGAPAFRTAFAHHGALQTHKVPEQPLPAEPIDYLPEHLHPGAAPATGESADVPTF